MTTLQNLVVLITIITFVQVSQQQCDPLYPRIFWNPETQEIAPNVLDHIFMFNTNVSCPYSFILVRFQTDTVKFRCTQKMIETFNDDHSPEFHTYIQTCSAVVNRQKQIKQFTYQLFGSAFIDSGSSVSSQQFLVEMPTLDLPLRLAVISDWGPIIDRPYKPLNDTLDYILQQRQIQKQEGKTNEWRINGLLLNGDYGYELQTDHCQRYVMFLNEISRITKFWPMMATLGNHQSFLPKSLYLFQESFQIGRISTATGDYTRTQAYRFMNRTTILFFDPFLQIYKKGTQQQYQTMKKAVIDQLHLKRDQFPSQFSIMASHYPVMCSQIDPHCRDALANMPDLYDYLSTQFNGKGMVDLYIGSHMHQYERIWPYVNSQFINESSPYKRGRMVNFVEAVAGVNYWQVEPYYEPQYFSVYATHNLTGMGILTISGSSVDETQPLNLRYKHIITPKTYEVVDQFEITNQFPQQKKEAQRLHLLSG